MVDDSRENLMVVNAFLKEKEYRIFTALSRQEALKLLEEQVVDLILLDVMMPGMDGFELCETIKSMDHLSDIPVIFLTARTESEDVVKGFRVGGVDYITKPFKKEELFARVNNHLQLKMTRDLLREYASEYKQSRDHFMVKLMELTRLMDQNRGG